MFQKLIILFVSFVGLVGSLQARVFTDDEGRTVDVVIAGVRGEYVILSKKGTLGRWPIARLSKEDQKYVEEWKKRPTKTPKISISLIERDGIGPEGAFEEEKASNLPKDIPMLRQTTESTKYKHYNANLTNFSEFDANHLTVSYILYIITPTRDIAYQTGEAPVGSLIPQERKSVSTKAIGSTRTKVKNTSFNISRLGGLSTGSDTQRSKERFGGAWARVISADGTVVGEYKKLHPELKRLDLAWTGQKEEERIPLLDALDALKELVKNIPPPPGGLPPKPNKGEKPQLPPKAPWE